MFNFIQKSILVENFNPATIATAVCSAPLFKDFGITPDMVGVENHVHEGMATGVFKITINIPKNHVDSDMAGTGVSLAQLTMALTALNFGTIDIGPMRVPFKPAKFVAMDATDTHLRLAYSINIQIPPNIETAMVQQYMQMLPDDLHFEGTLAMPGSKLNLNENAVDPEIRTELLVAFSNGGVLKRTMDYTPDNVKAIIANMVSSKVGEKTTVSLTFPAHYGSRAKIGEGDYRTMGTIIHKDVTDILDTVGIDLLEFHDNGFIFLPSAKGTAFGLKYTFSYR